jgi:hypothetical protein
MEQAPLYFSFKLGDAESIASGVFIETAPFITLPTNRLFLFV